MSAAFAKLVERAELRASETALGGDAALIRDLVTALKEKGPAKGATLPSQVISNTRKGSKMNIHASIMVAVPFPAQSAGDEMDQAVIRFRIISKLVDSRSSLDSDDLNEIQTILCDALDILEPVRAFLERINDTTESQDMFIDCRRQWIADKAKLAEWVSA